MSTTSEIINTLIEFGVEPGAETALAQVSSARLLTLTRSTRTLPLADKARYAAARYSDAERALNWCFEAVRGAHLG